MIGLKLGTGIKLGNKRYTAADVKSLIGMNRRTLFYSVKKLGLITPAQETPKAILYDFENLLDLALIHELLSWGISERKVKHILSHGLIVNSKIDFSSSEPWPPIRSAWALIRADRAKYEAEGCVLFLSKEPFFDYVCVPAGHGVRLPKPGERGAANPEAFILPLEDIADYFKNRLIKSKRSGGPIQALSFGGLLMIDLLALVHSIELKTGERLADPLK